MLVKSFKTTQLALLSILVTICLSWVVASLLRRRLKAEREKIRLTRNVRSKFIEKMLEDLGKELTAALEQYFGANLLQKISELKKKVNTFIIEIQKLRAETEIKDDYIRAYSEFITSFKEDFGWCGNCMASCFEITGKSLSKSTAGTENQEENKAEVESRSSLSLMKVGKNENSSVKVDLRCHKSCMLRYSEFLAKINCKLDENLIKIGIKEGKLMKDAKKLGPIDDSE